MEFTIEQKQAVIKAAEDNNIATDITVRIGDEETSIKREIKAIFIELIETIHYDSEFFEQTKVEIDNKTYSFLQSRFCKKCGKPFHLNDSEKGTDITNIMVENTYCFECSFWKQKKDVYLDKGKSIIIKEGDKLCHYVDGGSVEPETIPKGWNTLGHGGRQFHIDKFDDDIIISTNNLWCQGYIPEIWKTEFKENAQHIKI